MKKILSFILIFWISFTYSQTWSAYGIKVAPENEEIVVKIIDDYFTNNKIEGVTVSLYSIMFTAADLDFTHEVIFSGEGEAMAKLYEPGFQDTAWQLFSSKISNFADNVFSGQGWRNFNFGDTNPFQLVITFKGNWEEINKWMAMENKLNEKYPKDFRSFAAGGINVGGPSNEASHWMVTGWKTYADYNENWNNTLKFREQNPAFVKEKDKIEKDIDYSDVEFITKTMRVLVKQW